MRILIAPDSFKGSFTSNQVAQFIKKGILNIIPDAEIESVSIADGGEGTVESIVSALSASYRIIEVQGPLGTIVKAKYGLLKNATAVIEMAESTGLSLVPNELRNPSLTSSYGFGQQIKDAMDMGCKEIILGIGGSSTNDGGIGASMALGARFYDESNQEVQGNGEALEKISRIDISGLDNRLSDTKIIVACDVDNPLCGEFGASYVYGPQKGASPEMVEKLDKNLKHFAGLIKEQLGVDIADIPGSGAAGGMGGGLIAFFGARIVKGIDYILDLINIDKKVSEADYIITGEGRIDGQSVFGKVPIGIASRGKKFNKPVYAICGFMGVDAEKVYDCGIDAVLSSIVAPVTIEQAIKESPFKIEQAAERLFRIIKSVS